MRARPRPLPTRPRKAPLIRSARPSALPHRAIAPEHHTSGTRPHTIAPTPPTIVPPTPPNTRPVQPNARKPRRCAANPNRQPHPAGPTTTRTSSTTPCAHRNGCGAAQPRRTAPTRHRIPNHPARTAPTLTRRPVRKLTDRPADRPPPNHPARTIPTRNHRGRTTPTRNPHGRTDPTRRRPARTTAPASRHLARRQVPDLVRVGPHHVQKHRAPRIAPPSRHRPAPNQPRGHIRSGRADYIRTPPPVPHAVRFQCPMPATRPDRQAPQHIPAPTDPPPTTMPCTPRPPIRRAPDRTMVCPTKGAIPLRRHTTTHRPVTTRIPTKVRSAATVCADSDPTKQANATATIAWHMCCTRCLPNYSMRYVSTRSSRSRTASCARPIRWRQSVVISTICVPKVMPPQP